MSVQPVCLHTEYLVNMGFADGENYISRQEKMLIENIEKIADDIGQQLDVLDSDGNETIEVKYFGLNIYVDVVARGWNYRSIELLALDIMTDEGDVLDNSSRALFNTLMEWVNRLNEEAERLQNN